MPETYYENIKVNMITTYSNMKPMEHNNKQCCSIIVAVKCYLSLVICY